MKKILGILVLLFSLNACDDGDFNIESFDFTDVNSNACNSGENGFFIYKINDSEVLILQIPEINFKNEITPVDTPRMVDITSSNRVIYRLYSSTVTTAAICTNIPPANPIVSEEWNALSGTIEITTTVNKTVNETENSSVISGYTHNVVLRNVNFEKPDGNQQLFTELVYGTFITPATTPDNFGVDILRCTPTSTDLLLKISTDQAYKFTLDSSLFPNQETLVNQPRKDVINATNVLELIFYNDVVNTQFFCGSEVPTYPIPVERWFAEDGIADVSGIIEVTTTIEYEIPTDNQSPIIGYRHKVTLKKVEMKKDIEDELSVSFNLGDVYEFGEFVVLL